MTEPAPAHHATTTTQGHVPLCPECPWLGVDREGDHYAAHVHQRHAQEALRDHLRDEHGYGGRQPPAGFDTLDYDPQVFHVATIQRGTHGVLAVFGDEVTYLTDQSDPAHVLSYRTPVERAVLAARLRAWADACDDVPATDYMPAELHRVCDHGGSAHVRTVGCP